MNCFLAFDSQDFTRFSSIDGGFYVRKFTKVKEVSFYSKLSLEFPEELRIYRCGDLRVIQDCFKTISVAAPNVLRSERVSFQNTNSQLDNSKS